MENISGGAKKGLNPSSAIIVAAIIIAGAIFVTRGMGAKSVTGATESKFAMISEISQSDFVRGSDDAEITVIEYADFSCAYCGVFHPTMQKIVEQYDGRVRWVYRHLPIFNIEAAVASQCVGDLAGDDAFWNFADTMYLNRDKYGDAYYRELALEQGVIGEDYDRCVTSPLVKSQIQKDFSRVKILLGFNGTPHSVILGKGGKEYSFAGALPYEEVDSVISTLLE